MTPAVKKLEQLQIPFLLHEYQHDPGNSAYGDEAVHKLSLDPRQVFKTLVTSPDGKQLVVAIVPVANSLNLKALAKCLGHKKMSMADKALVSRTTGYQLGGVSPIGQKKPLPTVIDQSAATFAKVFVSGGRRGLEIELAPADLCTLTQAQYYAIAQ